MTDRVRSLIDELNRLSPGEREEFEVAFFEQLDGAPLDVELGREAARRLREAGEGGPQGALFDD
jgi:hypothetical protein